MAFEELSPNAEKLLQEIIEHRLPNGCCDSEHWKNRFKNISFDEDTRMRSLFKELREQEMISVQWADNYPYYLALLDKGYSYKESKKAYTKEKRKLSRREWRIAIVSAIIGGIIGLIPSIVQWLGGV